MTELFFISLLAVFLAGLSVRKLWLISVERAVSLRTVELSDALAQLRSQLASVEPLNVQSYANSDAIKAMEGELAHYFEQPFIGMLTAKHTKGTIHVNQRFCDMVGYTKEEMQSLDWGKLTHPDDLATNQALLDQAIRGEIDSYQLEKRYIHKDGHIVFVHLAVKCVRDSQGRPDYFIGMIMDISEHKLAEEVLMLESKKYETLLRTAGDGIHVLDLDGNVVQVNESFCRMLGYSLQEMQTMNVAQWDAQWYPDELKRLIASFFGRDATFETLHRRSDGSVLDVEINAVGVEIGGRLLVYCAGRDITQRKLAEKALRHKESMLARTESLAKIGSWEWQVKDDTVAWSDELYRLFQRDPSKSPPSFAEHPAMFPPEDMEQLRIAVENAIDKGLPYEIELRAIQANGELRHCVARGQAERGEDGAMEWLAGSFQDITERKKMEARLAYDVKVNAALAELSQAMIKPAANVQEILDTSLEVALSLTLSQSGYVSIADPETLNSRHSQVNGKALNMEFSQDGEGHHVAIRHTQDNIFHRLWSSTHSTEKAFFANHPETIAGLEEFHGENMPIHGILSVPALIEGRLMGRVALANPAFDYADHDLAVVEQIAVICASAIQRKRIEDALAENEQRFRAVFENAAVGIARVSLEGQFLEINQEFSRIIGYSQEEALSQGISFQRIIHAEDIETSMSSVQVLVDDAGHSSVMERRFIQKGGEIVWVIASIYLLRDTLGIPLYFIAALQDISLQKKDEEQLRLAAQVFESSGEAILVSDSNNRILSVNPAFTRVTGYSAAEVIGNNPRLLKSGLHGEAFYRELWAQLKTHGNWQGEIWNRRKNGEIFPVWQIISTVRNGNDEITNHVSLFIDITDRHQIEQELIAARDAAHASARAKSDFLANMSHEIRTPMNGILGLTRLALDQTLSPKVRSYLEKVHSSSDSLLRILNDILDYSKIEAGLLSIDDITFDLGEMLENLRNLFSYRAEEKSLSLDLVIASDVPRVLNGDSLRLQQVLTNLLGNALKFTETGGITLGVAFNRMDQDKVILSFQVADTGIGMNEEAVASLFRPFTQADASITRRFGGTGLGLAISSKLLELLDSEFKVESTPGKGTVFKFDLAFKLAKSNQEAQLLRQIQHPQIRVVGDAVERMEDLSGIRVLVAEDHPINRQVACEFLQKVGIQVGTASNGYEVLALLRREHFDAVFMDVNMPEMNGLEATRQLREDARYTNLPVIALTAGVTKLERDRALASGMNGFIAKPIEPEELLDTLKLWVRPRLSGEWSGLSPLHHNEVGNTLQLPEFDLVELEDGLGSQEAVISLLLQFRLDVMATMEKIEANIAGNDLKSAEWHLHQLKGTAGNVGAINLSAACQKLDEELKQGFYNFETLGLLRNVFRAARMTLDDLQRTADDIASQINSEQEFKHEAARIDQLLAQKYLIPDELMSQLEAVTPADRLDLYQQFKRHVGKIDYKKAREVLKRLTEN